MAKRKSTELRGGLDIDPVTPPEVETANVAETVHVTPATPATANGPQLREVTISIPMRRFQAEGGYTSFPRRHVELQLTTPEAQALADIYEGLRAQGKLRPADGLAVAVKSVLARIGEAFAFPATYKPL